MVRDVSRLDPSPEWVVRGEEGPASCPPSPSFVCRAWRPQPPRSERPPTAEHRHGCPEVLSVFYFGRKVS